MQFVKIFNFWNKLFDNKSRVFEIASKARISGFFWYLFLDQKSNESEWKIGEFLKDISIHFSVPESRLLFRISWIFKDFLKSISGQKTRFFFNFWNLVSDKARISVFFSDIDFLTKIRKIGEFFIPFPVPTSRSYFLKSILAQKCRIFFNLWNLLFDKRDHGFLKRFWSRKSKARI